MFLINQTTPANRGCDTFQLSAADSVALQVNVLIANAPLLEIALGLPAVKTFAFTKDLDVHITSEIHTIYKT